MQENNGETPPEGSYHYQVIARAIAYIDTHATRQPTLAEVAAATGLSEAHFQRVFSQWVGISPKRYLQYLTLDHARQLLRDHMTVLDTAGATGLSTPSRLHDLFVRWESMSPGEYARRGAGLVIRYGWFDSPFGEMLAMGTERGLCGLAFTAETGRAASFADMTARWPNARFTKDRASLAPLVGAALARRETPLHLIGAPFRIKVWEALLAVPEGKVTTYGAIARRIGNPKAVRAVGSAVGDNPLGWLIPCHRALRKSGELGGYHWGLPVKRAMLAYEAARRDAR